MIPLNAVTQQILGSSHNTAAVRTFVGSWLQQQKAKIAGGTQQLLQIINQFYIETILCWKIVAVEQLIRKTKELSAVTG